MIIKFKLFENYSGPKIGDWIICSDAQYSKINNKNSFIQGWSSMTGEISKEELVDLGKKKYEESLEMEIFIKNSMGKIRDQVANNVFVVIFANIPENIQHFDIGKDSVYVYKNDIIYWSKNKEDVETKLLANKYNL